MENFLTKENVIIIALVFYTLVQSNYFATKLDVANIRNEMLIMKTDLQKYSDEADKEILRKLDEKYEIIINKLDKRK